MHIDFKHLNAILNINSQLSKASSREELGVGSVTYGCFPLEQAQGDVHRDAGVGEDGGGLSVGWHEAADVCKGTATEETSAPRGPLQLINAN